MNPEMQKASKEESTTEETQATETTGGEVKQERIVVTDAASGTTESIPLEDGVIPTKKSFWKRLFGRT